MTLSFKHSGSSGDIVYAIPTIISLAEQHGDGKANLYLEVGVRADFYQGCVHPCGNVRMNEAVANALIPLLASQDVFAEVRLYRGDDQVDVDLDLFRMIQGIQYGHLPRHYFHAFDAWYDVASPWLSVTPLPGLHDRLVVGRTSRYHGKVGYAFLGEFRPIFVGLADEYLEFKKDVPSAEWVETDDMLKLAQVIAGAKCFVGNQSCAFAIAEALKKPRCLEACPWARNVIPQGGEARDGLNPAGFEANVRALMAG